METYVQNLFVVIFLSMYIEHVYNGHNREDNPCSRYAAAFE